MKKTKAFLKKEARKIKGYKKGIIKDIKRFKESPKLNFLNPKLNMLKNILIPPFVLMVLMRVIRAAGYSLLNLDIPLEYYSVLPTGAAFIALMAMIFLEERRFPIPFLTAVLSLGYMFDLVLLKTRMLGFNHAILDTAFGFSIGIITAYGWHSLRKKSIRKSLIRNQIEKYKLLL